MQTNPVVEQSKNINDLIMQRGKSYDVLCNFVGTCVTVKRSDIELAGVRP